MVSVLASHLSSMLSVVVELACDPSQVLYSVVSWVAVDVVYLLKILRIRNERFCN